MNHGRPASTTTAKRRFAAIGDCVALHFHAAIADNRPDLTSEAFRITSFAPALSARGGLPAGLLRRLRGPGFASFFRVMPIEHQFCWPTTTPRPDVVVTNALCELPPFLVRHESGVRFFVDWPEMERVGAPGLAWLRRTCRLERLTPAGYGRRLAQGLAGVARAFPHTPVVVLKPVSQCVPFFEADRFLVGHHDYPTRQPAQFRALAAELCARHENLYFLDADRIVIDGILHEARPALYYYPYRSPRHANDDAFARDLTHPSAMLFHLALKMMERLLDGGSTFSGGGIRWLHPPVTERQARLARGRRLPRPDETALRALIRSQQPHLFAFAVNYLEDYPEETFLDDLAGMLAANPSLRRHKLLRNVMLSYLARYPRPEFWPYLCGLFEAHLADMFSAGQLFRGKPYEALLRVRAAVAERSGHRRLAEELQEAEQRRRWGEAVGRLLERGCRRIGLFPAGRHTARLLPFLRADGRLEAVAAFDESADDQAAVALGLAIARPADAGSYGLDAVLISSDTYEEALSRRWTEAGPKGIPVFRIYSEEPSSR